MADKPKAKDAPAAADPAAEQPADDAPRKPSAVLSIVKAVAFVSILVIVQVVGASMLIPSAADTEQLAQPIRRRPRRRGGRRHVARRRIGRRDHRGADTVEIEIGRFNITHFNPASNSTLSIDFELYGSVLASDAGGI